MEYRVKVTVRQLLDAQPVLVSIASKPVKAVTAWKIGSRLRRLDSEVQVANEARSKIFAKYSDIEGDSYKPRAESIDALRTELDELLKQVVNVDVTPLNINVIDSIDITPGEAMAIDWIFSEDAE